MAIDDHPERTNQAGSAAPTYEIRDLDPADCLPHETNREVRDSELVELLASVETDGQTVAGIVGLHPTLPGKFLIAAGNRRRRCCAILGRPFRAEVRPYIMESPEILGINVRENVLRKNLKPFELCRQLEAFKEAAGIATWEEVARRFGFTPATVSRVISVRHVPADCRELAERVGPTVCWAIAAKKDPATIRRGLEFASTPDARGKLPSLKEVERHLASLKVDRPKGVPRPKPLKGSVKGRAVSIDVLRGDTTETIVAWLKDLAAQLSQHPKIPPESLGFLFKESRGFAAGERIERSPSGSAPAGRAVTTDPDLTRILG